MDDSLVQDSVFALAEVLEHKTDGAERFGLGYLVRQTSDQLKTAELFAAVIASTALGIGIFGAVSMAGVTILARWSGAIEE